MSHPSGGYNGVAESGGELAEAPFTGVTGRRVRYVERVLHDIRVRAVDQFLSIPRGGLEVGGLLFGRFVEDGVDILESEELHIEHVNGPGFQLSTVDEQTLSSRLSQPVPDRVVGWWHSHTRSGVEITAEDLRIHAKYFPDPRQISLILKPHQLDPAKVAVYGGGGELLSSFAFGDSVFREKPVVPAPPPLAPLLPVPPRTARLPAPARRRGNPWRGAFAALVLCGAAVVFWPTPDPIPPPRLPPVDPIRLAISESGEQMTVRWDRDARTLARDAELIIIDDGQVTRIPFSPDTPATGTLSYVRRGTQVEVRMRGRLENEQLFEAVALYVGPDKRQPEQAEAVPEPLPEPPKPVQEVRREVERARLAPQQEAPRRQVVTLPPVSVRRRQDVQLLSPPPVTPSSSAAEPVRLPVGPLSAPPPPARSPQQPMSGRAIWTGVLPRGGVLSIDGARASSGSLTGKLPQRPAKLRVYPADLTESGVVVYTAGSVERSEAPSAANGWNVTTYRPDVRRVRDVAVLEAPGQGNGWQRLMVRSDQRNISMLLIEWEAIQ